MITLVNKEDAQGLSIMELAREIKTMCLSVERQECKKCELYDENIECMLFGNDPSDWDI